MIFGFSSLILLLTALVALYFYLTRNFNYWKSRGIQTDRPIAFLGTFWKLFLKPIPEINLERYRKYGKIYGDYMGDRPVLVIADPELIKQINIKDFHVFVDRNDIKIGDPMNDRSLFNLMGDEWKKMRSIVSPTFSSGKMRRMHPMIIDCIKRLEENLEKTALNKEMNEIELKKVMSNLTMDVIASCAFGTRIDVYNEEKTNEFIINAQKVFSANWRVWITFLLMSTFPKLIHWIGLSFFDPSVINFFKSAIRSIITRRKSEKVNHKDYLQLMINAQNKTLDMEEQEVEADDSTQLYGQTESVILKTNKLNDELTDDDILATSFIFFTAGYETTATLLSHLFYSLAIDEKCQQKLYEEVMKFDGDYRYETIAKMPYLEACIAETLRRYNSIFAVGRMAAEEYTIGDTGITIPKGMLVNFDIQALHQNPEYYPEPEKWDPERFMPENRDLLTPYTYMPFGIGPRNCVGMRFALMEAKTAVAHLVHKFRFFRTANTTVPLRPQKFEFLLKTGNKIVGIELRNK